MATKSALKSDLRNASKALETAKVDNNEMYPDSLPGGVKSSDNVKLQYNATNSGTTYCLTASSLTNTKIPAYHIDTSSSQGTTIQEGYCSGHNSPISAACPTGFIKVPGNSRFSTSDFCVMKYEAKQASSNTPVSTSSGSPWVSISQTNAITVSQNACDGCHLITDNEWLTIAHNVLNQPSNWTGGSVGSGSLYRGNSNTSAAMDGTDSLSGVNTRTLTLSNGEVIWDLAGNVWEWTSGTTTSQPGTSGETAYAWKEWNAITTNQDALPTSIPSYGTAAAASYTGTNGIGRLYSNSSITGVRAFLRGGAWDYGTGAGVFCLTLTGAPSNTYTHVGFRVAQGD